MIAEELRRRIRSVDPHKKIVLLILLDVTSDLLRLSKIVDISARKRAIEQFTWDRKRPIINLIARYGSFGLSVVNEMDGSPSLVASGPARGWENLLAENQAFVADPEVKLASNEANWTIAN
jgi:hypothetical protein